LYYLSGLTAIGTITANGRVYYQPEPCTKDHVEDWPKTKTTVQGIQRKKTTTIYKDGQQVVDMLEYAYPHKKLTTTTVTKLVKQSTKTVVIEDISE